MVVGCWLFKVFKDIVAHFNQKAGTNFALTISDFRHHPEKWVITAVFLAVQEN